MKSDRRMLSLGRTFYRHRAIISGFIAQSLQYGAGLLLLPFVVTRLSAPEVGLWYIFITLQGLATLADFGFQPTIARGFASAYAGATHLQQEGLAQSAGRSPNLDLMRSILDAARQMYLILAAGLFVLLATAGLIYVSLIASRASVALPTVQIAWLLFSAGTVLNIYFLWISPLLLGTGRITSNYIFVSISRGGFALLGIGALFCGGGLLALSLANIAAVIIARLFATMMVAPLITQLPVRVKSKSSFNAMFHALWPNARRMGLVAVGAFLITRFNVLVISSFVGLTASSSYAITLQLLSAMQAMAQLPTQIALPQMVGHRIRHETAQLRRLILQRQIFLIAFVTCGIIILAMFGQTMLNHIGSRVQLLPVDTLILLGVVLLLEANHSNCAFVIASGNTVPFVPAALFSGIAIALLSTAAAWVGAGVVGVILAQGIAQLCYNNWKWPLKLYRDLKHG